jgi:hypothetical protein
MKSAVHCSSKYCEIQNEKIFHKLLELEEIQKMAYPYISCEETKRGKYFLNAFKNKIANPSSR